jgi:hypothetical protein
MCAAAGWTEDTGREDDGGTIQALVKGQFSRIEALSKYFSLQDASRKRRTEVV